MGEVITEQYMIRKEEERGNKRNGLSCSLYSTPPLRMDEYTVALIGCQAKDG